MLQFLTPIFLEFRQNARLRAGVWFIIALLLSYLVLVLNDYQVRLKQEYSDALTRLHQLQAIATQTQWSSRATTVQELRTQLEARLWQAETRGLAQAMFQSWLQEEFFFAKIDEPRLQVETALDVPGYSQIWQVSAQLNGVFAPKKLHTLLSTLGQNPRLVVVDRLEIRDSTPSRFTLMMSAYFAKGK